MTDRRVNDLSYGHLGETSYNTQQQTWSYSRDTGTKGPIQAVQPLQACIPASAPSKSDRQSSRSKAWTAPTTWLRKQLPEAEAAISLLSSLGRFESTLDTASPIGAARQLAIGKAIDLIQWSHHRHIQVLAIPYGEAGNILRLMKPRLQDLQWKAHKGVKLQTINPAASEEGHWLGDGGAIQQIVFGIDADGPTSWLAVRKAEGTSILRPIYHPLPVPSPVPRAFAGELPMSRLDPNYVLTLSNDRTGSRPHVDVTFNPWYIRQFAVVDQGGYWSLWDVEGQVRKRRTFELVAGRSGQIYDGYSFAQDTERPDGNEDWARILWAGNFSTLVVCNRHHLAIFDLKARPRRLKGSELMNTKTTGWILDVKRSPAELDHIFVLTTSHIFWLKIMPAGESEDLRGSGARVLLSCRHFRDGETESLKLELMSDQEVLIALLYSDTSLLVNNYRFSLSHDETTSHHCLSGAFTIKTKIEHTGAAPYALQDLAMLPTSLLKSHRSQASGPGLRYYNEDVHFYQLISLHPDLGLSQILCATSLPLVPISKAESVKYLPLEAPTLRRNVRQVISSNRVDDDFVVPDDIEESEEHVGFAENALRQNFNRSAVTRSSVDRSPTFNAHQLFELTFSNLNAQTSDHVVIQGCIHNIAQSLADRWDHGVQGSSTALELSGLTSFSEDVDEAAAALRELFDNFGQSDEDDYPLAFGLAVVRPNLITADNTGSPRNQVDLSIIYDSLVKSWISCLPHQTSGQLRIAKERLIRNIAAELCLSSIVMSLSDKSAKPRTVPRPEEEEISLPIHNHPNWEYSSQPSKFGSQATSGGLSDFTRGLPTPAQTPSAAASVASQDGSVYSADSSADDGAIARLRDYAISVKGQRPLGSAGSAILDHWPSTPGSNPWKYSWEGRNKVLGKDNDDDSDDEANTRRRREEEKRRRRTERFLQRQQAGTAGPASSQRIIPTAFESDPAGPPVLSSQVPGMSFAMSQPVLGAFASRNKPKQLKKRRTKGF